MTKKSSSKETTLHPRPVAMCRLLHVEWWCKHTQNIWEYCRDATAPSRTPSAEQANAPCETFVSKYGLTPKGPTDDEYRNFCCKFVCCLEDQAPVYTQVLELEEALGISPKESISHIPSFLLSRQQKSLKQARKKFQALAKRHEERCEALFYGLGFVEESDAYRAPAWSGISEERESEDEIQSMQDTRTPPRKRSDIQVRKSGEQPLEEEEAFEAPEVVALAENKA
jgi:hypothetical protein